MAKPTKFNVLAKAMVLPCKQKDFEGQLAANGLMEEFNALADAINDGKLKGRSISQLHELWVNETQKKVGVTAFKDALGRRKKVKHG